MLKNSVYSLVLATTMLFFFSACKKNENIENPTSNVKLSNVKSSITYIYDENEVLIDSMKFDLVFDDSNRLVSEYSHTEQLRIDLTYYTDSVILIQSHPSNTKEFKSVIYLNAFKRAVTQKSFSNGKLYSEISNVYSKNGKINQMYQKKLQSSSADSFLLKEVSWTGDNISSNKFANSNSIYQYVYDLKAYDFRNTGLDFLNNDKCLNLLKQMSVDINGKIQTTTYSYEFDAKNREIKRTEFVDSKISRVRKTVYWD